MPKVKVRIGDREIETWYEYPVLIPEDWVHVVRKLHPVTAIVIWEVMTGSLSPETISLAQTSPDWDRFTAIRVVAGGNPMHCKEVAEVARIELEEVFADLLPDYTARRVLQ